MATALHFIEQSLSMLENLRQTNPPTLRTIRAAGSNFGLHCWGEALFNAMWPGLAHLEIDPGLASTVIQLQIWDSATTGVKPITPPFSLEDYQRNHRWAMIDDGRVLIMHIPWSHIVYAYDRGTCQGLFWSPDPGSLTIYERAAPLQTLFHWALNERGWHILHAAAIGVEQGGALLVGNTGAGKSSTALACLQHPGLRYLSDDKCLATLTPGPQAFGIFSAAKLKGDMLDALPQFQHLVGGYDELTKGGKSLVYLYPEYRERMVTSFPIRFFLIANITRRSQAALRPASSSDVLKVLGPSTLHWLPGAEESSMRFMAALSRQLPAYWLDLALDAEQNIAAVATALDGER